MKDTYSALNFAHTLEPAARTASANGAGVDLRGYNSALVQVVAGVWTDGTHTPKLQESDDDSTYTDVAAADLLGSFTVIDGADDDAQTFKVGYKGNKRYIRGATTVAGATTGAVYGMIVIRSHANDAPVA
ncbi:hypothetical protein [Sinorhizobium meliloti]|uniref:hypothetical protein n=1 Tax=Rhizobium meliloti TaxID=382 RepID=UPI000B49CBE9|nr:hypothetical protein [Sinorhizobium meliloti]ASQ10647.1 hypothetical protein CDO22_11015 [Sinorhizobium meliloti]MQU81520.1 hypothetical protein [Sinorhizobium meliloti]MQU87252.1 hypothetical protein [Sinorhizobium meliloti]